jgi:hypothetical protein
MSTVEATGLKKDVEKWREILVITDSVLGWEKVKALILFLTVLPIRDVYPGSQI